MAVIDRDTNIPSNGLVYDGFKNCIYYIDAADNNIQMVKLDYSGNVIATTAIINAVNNTNLTSLAIDANNRWLI